MKVPLHSTVAESVRPALFIGYFMNLGLVTLAVHGESPAAFDRR